MKKTSRTITHAESSRRRTLRLSKEAIRTLQPGDLAVVAGAGACDTTSYTSEKQTNGLSANCK